jgi:hypothetical protein
MKGAQTLVIERKNTKDLVINMEDLHGDRTWIYCIARTFLNRASVDRTISKQESMCLLGLLHLTLCPENIETVYLTPFRRIVVNTLGKAGAQIPQLPLGDDSSPWGR